MNEEDIKIINTPPGYVENDVKPKDYIEPDVNDPDRMLKEAVKFMKKAECTLLPTPSPHPTHISYPPRSYYHRGSRDGSGLWTS